MEQAIAGVEHRGGVGLEVAWVQGRKPGRRGESVVSLLEHA